MATSEPFIGWLTFSSRATISLQAFGRLWEESIFGSENIIWDGSQGLTRHSTPTMCNPAMVYREQDKTIDASCNEAKTTDLSRNNRSKTSMRECRSSRFHVPLWFAPETERFGGIRYIENEHRQWTHVTFRKPVPLRAIMGCHFGLRSIPMCDALCTENRRNQKTIQSNG